MVYVAWTLGVTSRILVNAGTTYGVFWKMASTLWDCLLSGGTNSRNLPVTFLVAVETQIALCRTSAWTVSTSFSATRRFVLILLVGTGLTGELHPESGVFESLVVHTVNSLLSILSVFIINERKSTLEGEVCDLAELGELSFQVLWAH